MCGATARCGSSSAATTRLARRRLRLARPEQLQRRFNRDRTRRTGRRLVRGRAVRGAGRLCGAIAQRYPIGHVAGHEASRRAQGGPGHGFDWNALRRGDWVGRCDVSRRRADPGALATLNFFYPVCRRHKRTLLHKQARSLHARTRTPQRPTALKNVGNRAAGRTGAWAGGLSARRVGRRPCTDRLRNFRLPRPRLAPDGSYQRKTLYLVGL